MIRDRTNETYKTRGLVQMHWIARCRLKSFNLSTNIMPNLSKPEPLQQWKTPKYQDFPIYRHQGVDYRCVPENLLSKLVEQKDGWFWLSMGTSAVAIAAATHVILNGVSPAAVAQPQPQIVEKPVIVTQEKVVPTNCLMFCGGGSDRK